MVFPLCLTNKNNDFMVIRNPWLRTTLCHRGSNSSLGAGQPGFDPQFPHLGLSLGLDRLPNWGSAAHPRLGAGATLLSLK